MYRYMRYIFIHTLQSDSRSKSGLHADYCTLILILYFLFDLTLSRTRTFSLALSFFSLSSPIFLCVSLLPTRPPSLQCPSPSLSHSCFLSCSLSLSLSHSLSLALRLSFFLSHRYNSGISHYLVCITNGVSHYFVCMTKGVAESAILHHKYARTCSDLLYSIIECNPTSP